MGIKWILEFNINDYREGEIDKIHISDGTIIDCNL